MGCITGFISKFQSTLLGSALSAGEVQWHLRPKTRVQSLPWLNIVFLVYGASEGLGTSRG